jgi:hypothetical protein
MREFDGPWFDQEKPECQPVALLAEGDWSEPCEMDAGAVFACADGKFLVVAVSGCSCWPDRGSTQQRVCHDEAERDRVMRDVFGDRAGEMLDKIRDGKAVKP